MVTLQVREFDGQKRLLGSVNKQPFNVPYADSTKDELISLGERMEDVDTMTEFNTLVDEAMGFIESVSVSKIEEVAGTDLIHDKEKNKYFLKVGNKVSKLAVPQQIVDRIQKAVDLGLDPQPWVKFWTRWMRNPNLSADKTHYMMGYIDAPFTDGDKVAKLIEDGYSEEMAKEIATFDQISITKEGLIAAFKYVKLKDTTKSIEVDEKTKEQKIVEIKQSLHGKSTISINPINDKVETKKGEAFAAEDLIFVPPIMGDKGSAFTCQPIDVEGKFDDYSAHVIRVGMRHRLENWSKVNCNDGSSALPGLHVGGHHYVEGFGGKTNLLVDCLVDPAHVGAITDDLATTNYREDAAMRVLEYYVTGTHFAVNKAMYHPSAYAELLDLEWDKYKEEAIKAAEKAADEVSDEVSAV